MKINNHFYLYAGLGLLLIALLVRAAGVDLLIWLPIFTIAILLKAIFLIHTLRSKSFSMRPWLILILIGVALLVISLLFKYVFEQLQLRTIFFYAAISLKVLGLILMLLEKIRKR